MRKVRAVAQQALALAQRFASEGNLAFLQGAQAAQHAAGAAGRAGGEVMLLDQQRALAGASALACDGNSHDATANHCDLKVLAGKRCPVGVREWHELLHFSTPGRYRLRVGEVLQIECDVRAMVAEGNHSAAALVTKIRFDLPPIHKSFRLFANAPDHRRAL